jgi:hypothetical protein
MHHPQALSLAQHAHEGQIARLTSRIAADESLLALATTENTTGGGPDEHIFPDTPRRPIHHLRPIPAAALPGERLYRIVMSMRAAGRAMSGQRKRVDHRPGARLQVEVVEPAQHRLGMRHGRRRLPATANCLAGHRVHARLVARPRYGGTITVWGAASVAGPACPRSVASDKNRGLLPTSPDPKPPPALTGTETIAADPSRRNAEWSPVARARSTRRNTPRPARRPHPRHQPADRAGTDRRSSPDHPESAPPAAPNPAANLHR